MYQHDKSNGCAVVIGLVATMGLMYVAAKAIPGTAGIVAAGFLAFMYLAFLVWFILGPWLNQDVEEMFKDLDRRGKRYNPGQTYTGEYIPPEKNITRRRK